MTAEFNILIVEDNEKTFNVLKDALVETNYKLWRVTTGREALKLAKEICLMAVISELQIVDMDGIELIRRLKKTACRINVIVLTVYSFIDSGVKALEAGAYAYLLKPLNSKEVKLLLSRAIENSCLSIQAGRRRYYQDMSILDGLTGIYNHRHFHEMLDWQITHLQRFPQTFSLFIIDIDNFKGYNDTKGHLAGDKMLYASAQLFVSSVRDSDMVFRYGGEEFAIILPQTPAQHAQKVGERLITAVRNKLPITVSAGTAAFPVDAQTKSDLINRADKALYRAKRLGKDRICVYDERVDR